MHLLHFGDHVIIFPLRPTDELVRMSVNGDFVALLYRKENLRNEHEVNWFPRGLWRRTIPLAFKVSSVSTLAILLLNIDCLSFLQHS